MCNTGLYQRGPTFSTSSYYYGLSYFGAVMLVYSMSQLPPKLFTEVLHCNLPWQELSKIPAGNAHLYTGVWPGFRSWNQPFLWQKILHWQVSVAQLKAPFDLFNRWLECIVLWVKSPQNPLNFLMFNIPMLMLQSGWKISFFLVLNSEFVVKFLVLMVKSSCFSSMRSLPI